MRRARIVCTIGPPSQDREILSQMIDAGMNVARLNMSHGTREKHAEVIRTLRELEKEKGVPVAVLQDLSGVKIRLGELAEPVELATGDVIELTNDDIVGDSNRLPINYFWLFDELAPGDRFSMVDGLIELEIIDKHNGSLRARVLSDGVVSSRKGVNLPRGGLKLPAMTEKDEADLRFGLEEGVDFVALSFVRLPEHADPPRKIMDEMGRRVPLIAKIEKQHALENIDGILETFDGLMVARGDLGIESKLVKVPSIQKDLIRRANRAAKPVITATQMLLSMVTNPRPTRAEVTDVANAVLDGTDAVMLSEETAQGERPVKSVRMLAEIVEHADEQWQYRALVEDRIALHSEIPIAIAQASKNVAHKVDARAIITPTTSGATARLVSSTRPRVPILALSSNTLTVHNLCLVWGVIPTMVERMDTADQLFEVCRREALKTGWIKKGDSVVITAGLPINEPGTTSLLQVMEI